MLSTPTVTRGQDLRMCPPRKILPPPRSPRRRPTSPRVQHLHHQLTTRVPRAMASLHMKNVANTTGTAMRATFNWFTVKETTFSIEDTMAAISPRWQTVTTGKGPMGVGPTRRHAPHRRPRWERRLNIPDQPRRKWNRPFILDRVCRQRRRRPEDQEVSSARLMRRTVIMQIQMIARPFSRAWEASRTGISAQFRCTIVFRGICAIIGIMWIVGRGHKRLSKNVDWFICI